MRRLPGGLAIDIADRNPYAVLGKSNGDRAADPVCAARYERALTAELRIRQTWPSANVNKRVPPILVSLDSDGKPKYIAAATWLYQNRGWSR
jgi:hypothetical protein